MTKFTIVSRDDEKSIEVSQQMKTRLINAGLLYDDKKPDIVCIVGGDGTFLSAVNSHIKDSTKPNYVCLNTGTLGFYSDYQVQELDSFINDIINNTPTVEKLSLLSIKVKSTGKEYFAVNEVRIESIRSQAIKVYINDDFLEDFRGCGLSLSTRMGSTGYTRSIGGAIIHSSLDVLQMCEVAGIHNDTSHSLSSPLIMDKHTKVRLSLNNFTKAQLCYDRELTEVDKVEEIEISISNKYINLAHYRPYVWSDHLKCMF